MCLIKIVNNAPRWGKICWSISCIRCGTVGLTLLINSPVNHFESPAVTVSNDITFIQHGWTICIVYNFTDIKHCWARYWRWLTNAMIMFYRNCSVHQCCSWFCHAHKGGEGVKWCRHQITHAYRVESWYGELQLLQLLFTILMSIRVDWAKYAICSSEDVYQDLKRYQCYTDT